MLLCFEGLDIVIKGGINTECYCVCCEGLGSAI